MILWRGEERRGEDGLGEERKDGADVPEEAKRAWKSCGAAMWKGRGEQA
jgi:hypothetical protein